MPHRYTVGQVLHMRPSPQSKTHPAGLCEVRFRLPHDRGPILYRVRPLNDKVERVVAEVDLVMSDTPGWRPKDAVPPFTIAVSRR